jgi:hypothetical protein
MFNRIALCFTALTLFSAAPAFATSTARPDKSASKQGLLADAFFSPTTIAGPGGVTESVFNNSNDPNDPVIDVFQLPTNFQSGTPYTMTFASLTPNLDGGLYGIFDCGNGNVQEAFSEDSPEKEVGTTCTAENLGDGDALLSFNENDATNTVTVSFIGNKATAPPEFFLWTTDGNLKSFAPASSTGTVPEPGTFGLLASGLLAIALFRRRIANA